MYFTQTTIRNNRVTTDSDYVSTRLIRKGEITSYYVVKCLMHRTDPTIVGKICFLKQTMVRQEYRDPLDFNIPYRQMQESGTWVHMQFQNEVRVHTYIQNNINQTTKMYSKLYDYWHDTDGVYHRFTVVTKYEQFGDLNNFLEYVIEQKIQLLDVEVIYIMNNLFKASLELYKAGIIHRDIKPENIFIDQFFQVKLGDFGISLLDEKTKKPESNERVGTYGFMAPQMFQDGVNYSFPIDVWALATVFYYMMYLRYPYGREKQNYKKKVNGRLKDIEHASTYNDFFSKRLKEFMRGLFKKNPSEREKAINLYEYEYMHDFRLIQVTVALRKKYEDYVRKVNLNDTLQIERFCLQQHTLYHQKVLDVVRYEQWGYFLLLSNLKVIGLFNSPSDKKLIKIFPDCLDKVKNPKEDIHCVIISYVYKTHFHRLRQYLELKQQIYIKRFNCTIDNIVQYKDTLAVRLKLDFTDAKKKEEPFVLKVGNKYEQYEQYEPTTSNKQPLDYVNKTFQIFYFPRQEKTKQLKYTTYGSSIVFNNNMDSRKQEEVLITQIPSQKEDFRMIQMAKYPKPQNILYSDNSQHKKMYSHAKKMLGFVANHHMEDHPQTVTFLEDYVINES